MRALPQILEDLRKERQTRLRLTLAVLGLWALGTTAAVAWMGHRPDLFETSLHVHLSIAVPALVGVASVLWTQGPLLRPEAWLRQYMPAVFLLTAAWTLATSRMPVRSPYSSLDWLCFWECLGTTLLMTGLTVGLAFRYFRDVLRPTVWTRTGFIGGLAFLSMAVVQFCCGHPDALHIGLSHLLPVLMASGVAFVATRRHRPLGPTLPPARA